MSRSKLTLAAFALIILGAMGCYFLRSASDDHDQKKGPVESSILAQDRAMPSDPKRLNNSMSAHSSGSVKPLDATDDPITSKFLVTKECYYARLGIKRFQAIADCQNLASQQENAREYGECLQRWDEDQATITRLQRQIETLKCPDDADLVRAYYDSTKQAARHGDPNAQLCYLQSHFPGFDERNHYTEQDIADYKASSTDYIYDAFKRGDWRIVQQLSGDHRSAITGLAIGIPDIGTPSTIHKMLTLLRIGAIDEYAEQLDSQIDDLERPDGKENPKLPQSLIDEDKAWAKETYSKYFSNSPTLKQPPHPCDTSGY